MKWVLSNGLGAFLLQLLRIGSVHSSMQRGLGSASGLARQPESLALPLSFGSRVMVDKSAQVPCVHVCRRREPKMR